jgi:hypothetical protein
MSLSRLPKYAATTAATAPTFGTAALLLLSLPAAA